MKRTTKSRILFFLFCFPLLLTAQTRQDYLLGEYKNDEVYALSSVAADVIAAEIGIDLSDYLKADMPERDRMLLEQQLNPSTEAGFKEMPEDNYPIVRTVSLTYTEPVDHYLPVSSTSEAAKAAYYKALQASEQSNMTDFFKGMSAAIELDPGFFMAYTYLALAETAFTEYDKATAYIKSAMAIDAAGLNKSERVLRKALQALDTDPKADVLPQMESLIAAYPNTAQAHDMAAITAFWISKDPQASVRHTLRLIELRPNYSGAYNALGYSYMDLKKMDKAKAAFEQYLKLSPDVANAYDSMAEYYWNVEDYAQSAKYYDKAAAMGMESSKERADQARMKMK